MWEQIIEYAQPILSAFAGKNGVMLQVVTIVGTARLFFKPIMEGISRAVKESPSTKDDVLLEKVQSGKAYKVFVFLLDLLGSIKAPVVKSAAVSVQKAVGPAPVSTEEKKEETK